MKRLSEVRVKGVVQFVLLAAVLSSFLFFGGLFAPIFSGGISFFALAGQPFFEGQKIQIDPTFSNDSEKVVAAPPEIPAIAEPPSRDSNRTLLVNGQIGLSDEINSSRADEITVEKKVVKVSLQSLKEVGTSPNRVSPLDVSRVSFDAPIGDVGNAKVEFQGLDFQSFLDSDEAQFVGGNVSQSVVVAFPDLIAFSSARVTLPKDAGLDVRAVCSCWWNFVESKCSSEPVCERGDKFNLQQNDSEFSFDVSHFSAYYGQSSESHPVEVSSQSENGINFLSNNFVSPVNNSIFDSSHSDFAMGGSFYNVSIFSDQNDSNQGFFNKYSFNGSVPFYNLNSSKNFSLNDGSLRLGYGDERLNYGWNSTFSMQTVRYGLASVVWNGRVYALGGNVGSSDTGSEAVNSTESAAVLSDGSFGAWRNETPMQGKRYYFSAVVWNSRIYAIGGYNSSNLVVASVESAPILSNGSLGDWRVESSIQIARRELAGVVWNDRIYIVGGRNSAGTTIASVESAPILSNGSLGSWRSEASGTAMLAPAAVVWNNRFYRIGGFSGSASASVESAPILSNGSVGGWISETSMGTARHYFFAVPWNGRIYSVGGHNGAAAIATVESTPILANGSIGDWSSADNPMGIARHKLAGVVWNGRTYAMGGNNGGSFSSTESALINSANTLSAWRQERGLSSARYGSSAVAWNNRVYLVGGTTGAYIRTVESADLLPNGSIGSWNSEPLLSVARAESGIVAWNGRVYALAGSGVGDAAINYTESAPILANGSLGDWRNETQLPKKLRFPWAVVWSGRVYVVGGYDGDAATASSSTYSAPVLANGSLGNWRSETVLNTARGFAPTVVYNGIIYTVGGCTGGSCGSIIGSSEFAPILSNGSLGSWTTGTSATSYYASGGGVWNGRFYMTGGGAGGPTVNAVQSAPILSNGSLGSWIPETVLTQNRYEHGSIVWNGRIYSFGGYVPSYTDRVDSALIQNLNSFGNYTSRVIDLNDTKLVSGVNWTSFNSNGSLNFVYRVGSDSSNLGSFSSPTSSSDGSNYKVVGVNGRFVQYAFVFNKTGSSATTEWTPELYDVVVNYQNVLPNVTFATLLPNNTALISIVADSSNLSILANASSPVGRNVSLVYNWFVNGISRTVLNLPFDNRSDGNFTDFSPFANNGSPKNGVVLNLTGGKVGAGVQFDGVDDYVNVLDSSSLNLTKKLSIEYWVYPTTLGGTRTHISKWKAAGSSFSWIVQTESSTFKVYFNGAAYLTSSLSANVWSHVVVTYDGSSTAAKIYINGVEAASTSSAPSSLNYYPVDVYIGAHGDPATYFQGNLDEVKLYNVSLTAQQVAANYQAGLNGYRDNVTVSQETFPGHYWNATVCPLDSSGLAGACVWTNNTVQVLADVVTPSVTFATLLPNNSAVISTVADSSNLSILANASSPVGRNVSLVYNWFVNGSARTLVNIPVDNITSGQVTDFAGFDSNGTLNGVTFNFSGGKIGSSLSFDGVDDGVDLGSSSLFDESRGFTASFWVNPSPVSESASPVVLRLKATTEFLFLMCQNTCAMTAGFRGLANVIASNATYNLTGMAGSWHHIVISYNGGSKTATSSYKYYVDGTSIEITTTGAQGGAVNANEIGKNAGAGGTVNDYNGSIDEFILYDGTLSEQQVAAIYQNGVNGYRDNVTVSNETQAGQYWNATVCPLDSSGLAGACVWTNNTVRILADVVNPQIAFVAPTPANATSTYNGTLGNPSLVFNVSVVTSNLSLFRWNWNGLNYSIFDNSFVLGYNFDNDSTIGDTLTKVVDLSSSLNNGTISGGASYVVGKFSNALNFDGVNDFVTPSNAVSYASTANFTLELWYKGNDTSVGHANIGKTLLGWDSSAIYGSLSLKNGYAVYAHHIGSWQLLNSTAFVADNNWHHIVLVNYANETGDFYVDGVRVSNGSTAITGGQVFRLDTLMRGYNGEYTNGSLDEMRVYNRTLTSAEILQRYNGNGFPLAGSSYQISFGGNLSRISANSWQFVSNQTVLQLGNYTYFAYAKDVSGGENSTETRNLEILDSKPSVAFATLLPNNTAVISAVLDSSNLSILANGSSPVGRNVSLVYNWFVNGISRTVLNLPFDLRNDGNTTDFSVRANNGSVSGAVFNLTGGRVGGAYTFDGVNDFIQLPTQIQFASTNAFALELWYKGTDSSAGHANTGNTLIGWDNIGTYGSLSLKGGHVLFMHFNGAWLNNINSTSNVADNNWHHIAYVNYPNQTGDLYIDGVKEVSNASSVLDASFRVDTLMRGWSGEYTNGTIDEVKVYNVSLSSQQVAANYQAGLNGYRNNVTVSQETQANQYWNATVCALDSQGVAGSCVWTNNTVLVQADLVCSRPPYGMLRWFDADANFGNLSKEIQNGYDAILRNGASIGSGKVGSAFVLDGSNDFANASDAGLPTGTQARTVDAWVKTTATDERYAVAYGTIASSQGLLLGVLSGKFVVTQIGASISSTSNINDGNWHHVAVTYDGSTYRLFVDGVQENSGSMTTATTLSGTIWIGSNSGPSVWSGSVDEVEFFNRQLSAAEIQAIYNASSAGKCKPPTIGNATLLPSSSVNSSVNLSIVSFNVSDFNNDGIELVYNWYVNGRGRTILNVPFDNRTDGNFSDFSGFGNTGAPKNGVVLNLSGGRIGAGIQLDGVNDYVDIADAPFDLEKNFSLEAWVNLKDLTDNQVILHKTSAYGLYYGCTACSPPGGLSNRFAFVILNSAGTAWQIASSSFPAVIGQWFHIVGTFNGSILKLYINGTLAGTYAYSGNAAQSNSNIAIGGVTGGNNLNGSIDEVKVYNNTVLTAEQVAANYQAGLNGFRDNVTVHQETEVGQYWNATVCGIDSTGLAGACVWTNNTVQIVSEEVNPLIFFVAPTPANATSTFSDSPTFNVTTIHSGLKEFGFNLNGSNYSFFNSNLNLMLNFNNKTSLGENSSFYRDLSNYQASNFTPFGNAVLTSSGKYGSAMSFDGSGDYVQASNTSRLDWIHGKGGGNLTFTVMAWLKSSSADTGKRNVIYASTDGGTNRYGTGFELVDTSTTRDLRLYFVDNTGTAKSATISGYPEDTNWHHLALTFFNSSASNNMNVYVDGEFLGAATFSMIPFNGAAFGSFRIGLWGYNEGLFAADSFSGLMDDFRIFNYTLNASEIKQNYFAILDKLNSTTWQLALSEKSLSPGNYTYYGFAVGSFNSTETRYLEILDSKPNVTFATLLPNNTAAISLVSNSQNLSILANASSPIGSNVSLVYNWYANGLSRTLLNMPFDNRSDGKITDFSRFANNGTLISDAFVNSTGGKLGGGLQLDGVDDFVSAGNDSSLRLSNKFTLMAWVNPKKFSSSGGSQILLAKGSCSTNFDYEIYLFSTTNQPRFYSSSLSPTTSTASASIPLNAYAHLAVTYDGSALSFYVNGSRISSSAVSGSITASASPLNVGRQNPDCGSSYYFNGSIDEVKVYNVSLTSNQIVQEYQNNLNGFRDNVTVHQETEVGQYWNATVCPIDGQGLAGSCTFTNNTAQIVSSLQPIANVVLNATSPDNLTIDNLTLYYNAFGSGGNFTDWRKNGASIAILNLPFNIDASLYGQTVADYTTFSNNGTLGASGLGDSAEPQWTSGGKIGGGYNFDGSNDYIDVGTGPTVTGTSAFSLEAWIKTTDANGGMIITQRSPAAYVGAYQFYVESTGHLYFNTYDGDFHAVETTKAVNDNQWHHAVLVREASGTLKIYVDGILNATAAGAADTLSVINTYIGANVRDGSNYFNGTIDEVKVYRFALNSTQIYENYAHGFQNKSNNILVSNFLVANNNYSSLVGSCNQFECVLSLSNNVSIRAGAINVTANLSNSSIRRFESAYVFGNVTYITNFTFNSVNYVHGQNVSFGNITIFYNSSQNYNYTFNATNFSNGFYNISLGLFNYTDNVTLTVQAIDNATGFKKNVSILLKVLPLSARFTAFFNVSKTPIFINELADLFGNVTYAANFTIGSTNYTIGDPIGNASLLFFPQSLRGFSYGSFSSSTNVNGTFNTTIGPYSDWDNVTFIMQVTDPASGLIENLSVLVEILPDSGNVTLEFANTPEAGFAAANVSFLVQGIANNTGIGPLSGATVIINFTPYFGTSYSTTTNSSGYYGVNVSIPRLGFTNVTVLVKFAVFNFANNSRQVYVQKLNVSANLQSNPIPTATTTFIFGNVTLSNGTIVLNGTVSVSNSTGIINSTNFSNGFYNMSIGPFYSTSQMALTVTANKSLYFGTNSTTLNISGSNGSISFNFSSHANLNFNHSTLVTVNGFANFSDGTPMSNAAITINLTNATNNVSIVATATTNAIGAYSTTFTTPSIATGLNVTFNATDGATAFNSTQIYIEKLNVSNVSFQVLSLPIGDGTTNVTGKVLFANGTELPSCTVTAFDGDTYRTVSNSTGCGFSIQVGPFFDISNTNVTINASRSIFTGLATATFNVTPGFGNVTINVSGFTSGRIVNWSSALAVSGVANYSNGAPIQSGTVTLDLNGSITTTTTNPQGFYSTTVIAPAQPGNYSINVTVSKTGVTASNVSENFTVDRLFISMNFSKKPIRTASETSQVFGNVTFSNGTMPSSCSVRLNVTYTSYVDILGNRYYDYFTNNSGGCSYNFTIGPFFFSETVSVKIEANASGFTGSNTSGLGVVSNVGNVSANFTPNYNGAINHDSSMQVFGCANYSDGSPLVPGTFTITAFGYTHPGHSSEIGPLALDSQGCYNHGMAVPSAFAGSPSTPGNYTITVFAQNSDGSTTATLNISVYVERLKITASIANNSINVAQTTYVNGTVRYNNNSIVPNANVSIYFAGLNYSGTTNAFGRYNISIGPFYTASSGTLSISATDGIFTGDNATVPFTVNPGNGNMTISVFGLNVENKVNHGNSINVSGVVNYSDGFPFTGTIGLSAFGSTFTTLSNASGAYFFSIQTPNNPPAFPANNYTVVAYTINPSLFAANASNVFVEMLNVSITAFPNTTGTGENITVINGTVRLSNGTLVSSGFANGSLVYSPLSSPEYFLNFSSQIAFQGNYSIANVGPIYRDGNLNIYVAANNTLYTGSNVISYPIQPKGNVSLSIGGFTADSRVNNGNVFFMFGFANYSDGTPVQSGDVSISSSAIASGSATTTTDALGFYNASVIATSTGGNYSTTASVSKWSATLTSPTNYSYVERLQINRTFALPAIQSGNDASIPTGNTTFIYGNVTFVNGSKPSLCTISMYVNGILTNTTTTSTCFYNYSLGPYYTIAGRFVYLTANDSLGFTGAESSWLWVGNGGGSIVYSKEGVPANGKINHDTYFRVFGQANYSDGTPIANGTVSLSINPTASGPTDPLGKFNISIISPSSAGTYNISATAYSGGVAFATNTSLLLEVEKLKVNIANWPDSLYTGQQYNISGNISYNNGSLATNCNLTITNYKFNNHTDFTRMNTFYFLPSCTFADIQFGPWYRGMPEAVYFNASEINTTGNYTGDQYYYTNIELCSNYTQRVEGLCGGTAVPAGASFAISGNITYCDGKPIVGATVQTDIFASLQSLNLYYYTCPGWNFGITDDSGEFSIPLTAVDRPMHSGGSWNHSFTINVRRQNFDAYAYSVCPVSFSPFSGPGLKGIPSSTCTYYTCCGCDDFQMGKTGNVPIERLFVNASIANKTIATGQSNNLTGYVQSYLFGTRIANANISILAVTPYNATTNASGSYNKTLGAYFIPQYVYTRVNATSADGCFKGDNGYGIYKPSPVFSPSIYSASTTLGHAEAEFDILPNGSLTIVVNYTYLDKVNHSTNFTISGIANYSDGTPIPNAEIRLTVFGQTFTTNTSSTGSFNGTYNTSIKSSPTPGNYTIRGEAWKDGSYYALAFSRVFVERLFVNETFSENPIFKGRVNFFTYHRVRYPAYNPGQVLFVHQDGQAFGEITFNDSTSPTLCTANVSGFTFTNISTVASSCFYNTTMKYFNQFTFPVVVKANDSYFTGNNSKDLTVIHGGGSISVNVLNLTILNNKKFHLSNETFKVEGNASYFDKVPVDNGTVNISIYRFPDDWFEDFHYRFALKVNASNLSRGDSIVEFQVDLQSVLENANFSETFDVNSVRVTEFDSTFGFTIPSTAVTGLPSQFSKNVGSNSTSNGTIMFTITAAANSVKYYYIYFDSLEKTPKDDDTGRDKELYDAFDDWTLPASNSTLSNSFLRFVVNSRGFLFYNNKQLDTGSDARRTVYARRDDLGYQDRRFGGSAWGFVNSSLVENGPIMRRICSYTDTPVSTSSLDQFCFDLFKQKPFIRVWSKSGEVRPGNAFAAVLVNSERSKALAAGNASINNNTVWYAVKNLTGTYLSTIASESQVAHDISDYLNGVKEVLGDSFKTFDYIVIATPADGNWHSQYFHVSNASETEYLSLVNEIAIPLNFTRNATVETSTLINTTIVYTNSSGLYDPYYNYTQTGLYEVWATLLLNNSPYARNKTQFYNIDPTGLRIYLFAPSGTYNYGASIPINYTIIGIPQYCYYELSSSTATDFYPLPGCTGTATLVSGLAVGNYSIRVWANNSLGTINVSNGLNFSIVNITSPFTALQLNITSPSNGSTHQANASITLSYTYAGIAESCWYSIDGAANTSLADCTTFPAFNISAAGAHSITLYANNSFGETASYTSIFTITSAAAPSTPSPGTTPGTTPSPGTTPPTPPSTTPTAPTTTLPTTPSAPSISAAPSSTSQGQFQDECAEIKTLDVIILNATGSEVVLKVVNQCGAPVPNSRVLVKGIEEFIVFTDENGLARVSGSLVSKGGITELTGEELSAIEELFAPFSGKACFACRLLVITVPCNWVVPIFLILLLACSALLLLVFKDNQYRAISILALVFASILTTYFLGYCRTANLLVVLSLVEVILALVMTTPESREKSLQSLLGFKLLNYDRQKLFDRDEVTFLIDTLTGTPSREYILFAATNYFRVPKDRIEIVSISQLFGSKQCKVTIHIYNRTISLRKYEPKFEQIRDMPAGEKEAFKKPPVEKRDFNLPEEK